MTATAYGLYGEVSRDFLSFGGRPLFHDNPAELEFLVRGPSLRVRVMPADLVAVGMPIRAHPDLVGVRWPLRREDFQS